MTVRFILLALMFAIVIAGYRIVMDDTHVINDDDVFIGVDTARECKVYVTPATLKSVDNRAFEVTVKRFFHEKFVVNESTFYFWEEGGVVFYRIGDDNIKHKIEGDGAATEIWKYCLNSLDSDK